MAKDHGSSVKDDKQYEGASEEGHEQVAYGADRELSVHEAPAAVCLLWQRRGADRDRRGLGRGSLPRTDRLNRPGPAESLARRERPPDHAA